MSRKHYSEKNVETLPNNNNNNNDESHDDHYHHHHHHQSQQSSGITNVGSQSHQGSHNSNFISNPLTEAMRDEQNGIELKSGNSSILEEV
jgi:hypothetical protein